MTLTQNNLNDQITSFNSDISDMELQITAYQTMLQNEFTNMETVINSLKTTGDTLTNVLAQLPSFNAQVAPAQEHDGDVRSSANKYVSDSVHTMSPGHLIVALYDRVLLDFERAISAMHEQQHLRCERGADPRGSKSSASSSTRST